MKDFVIRNPKYERSGNQRELADLLLVLDDSCIVVSVKGTDGKFKSKTKLKNWLAKKTLEGLRQAKGGINWLSKVQFSGKNGWGEVRQFPPNSLNPLCGIVLLECSQQPFGAIGFTTSVPESAVPLHFISLNDFLNLVNWLSSIWDVFDYFSKRANVRQMFTGINQERPVIAYYTLRHTELAGVLSASKTELAKLRDLHQLYLLENIDKYEERKRLAAHVNAIVHALHTRDSRMEDYWPANLKSGIEPVNQRVSYLKMAAILNALPMSDKAFIGRRLENILERLRDSGEGRYLAFQRPGADMVLVFACFSKRPRHERAENIFGLLRAALYKHKVTNGLAVAIDADDDSEGYDLIWAKGYTDFDEHDRKLSELFFPEPIGTVGHDAFGIAGPFPLE